MPEPITAICGCLECCGAHHEDCPVRLQVSQLREEIGEVRTDNERLKRDLEEAKASAAVENSNREVFDTGRREWRARAESFKRERDEAREALSDAADHLAGATGLTPGDQIKIDEACAAMEGTKDETD